MLCFGFLVGWLVDLVLACLFWRFFVLVCFPFLKTSEFSIMHLINFTFLQVLKMRNDYDSSSINEEYSFRVLED